MVRRPTITGFFSSLFGGARANGSPVRKYLGEGTPHIEFSLLKKYIALCEVFDIRSDTTALYLPYSLTATGARALALIMLPFNLI